MNTAQLRQGLDQAKEHLHGFGEQFKEIGEKISTLTELAVVEFGTEIVKSIAEFTLKSAEAADQLGKTAAAAQVPVETFQRLSYAAKLGGVDTETLGSAFNKLNKALGEASVGSAKQASLFQALGVNIKDSSGHARDSADVFNELASKLDAMAPGYAKATIEQELFGKSGTALDTALHNVAEGMAAAGGEADKLGLVLSARTIQAATEFNENIEKLKLGVEGLASRVVAELAPALSELTTWFTKSEAAAQTLSFAVGFIASFFKVLASVAIVAVDKVRTVASELAGLAAVALSLVEGDLAGATEAWKAQNENLKKITDDTASQLATVWLGTTTAVEKAGEAHRKTGDSVLAASAAAQKAAEDQKAAFKKLEGVLDEYEKKLAEFDKSPLEALEARFTSGGDLAEVFRKAGAGADALKAKIIAVAEQLQLLKENKLVDEVDFKVRQTVTASGHDASSRREAFNSIGETSRGQANLDTAGFQSFDDALTKLALETKRHAETLGTAELLKEQHDEEGARAALEQAAQQQLGADAAKKAADGFKKIAELDLQDAENSIKQLAAGIAGAANHMLSKLGELGTVVSSAIQGFQQGGWWGAIAAVIIELFSRFKRFAEIQKTATDQLYGLVEQLGPALNRLTNGFEKLQGSLGKMTETVGTALGPVLDELGRIFGLIGSLLGPIFGAIEDIIGPVTDILHLFTGLASVLDPLNWVIKLVSYLFTLVGIAFLEISNGLQTGIAMFIELIRDMLIKLGFDAPVALYQLASALRTGANDAQAKVEKMWSQLGNDVNHFLDLGSPDAAPDEKKGFRGTAVDARIVKDFSSAIGKSTTALNKMTESLTNVPTGFRVALARYGATAPEWSKGAGGGDVHVHISGGVMTTVQQLTDAIRKTMNQLAFQKTGRKPPP